MSNPHQRAKVLRHVMHELNPSCLAIAGAFGLTCAVRPVIEVAIVDKKPAAQRIEYERLGPEVGWGAQYRREAADRAEAYITTVRRHAEHDLVVEGVVLTGATTGRMSSTHSNIEEV